MRDGCGRLLVAGAVGVPVADGPGLAVADGAGLPWGRPGMAGRGRLLSGCGGRVHWGGAHRARARRGRAHWGRAHWGRAGAGGPRGVRRHRRSDRHPRNGRAAGSGTRGSATWLGAGCPARRLALAVAVEVVPAHQADQVRPVVGVGRVDAGQRGRELVGMLPVAHGLLVVAAAGQEPAVIVDALGYVVIHAEGRRRADRLAVHVFLGGQRHAARGAGALDAEQVVIPGGELLWPHPDSSMAWAMVTAAGTPYRR